MSLFARAYYIADHAYEMAGPTHRVEDCFRTDWENILLVAKGEKPLCEVPPDLTIGKVRSIPQVEGLQLSSFRVYLLGHQHIPCLFGKPDHIEAYDLACMLRNRGLDPQADALFGLAFGYPEDKIARFVVNGIDRLSA